MFKKLSLLLVLMFVLSACAADEPNVTEVIYETETSDTESTTDVDETSINESDESEDETTSDEEVEMTVYDEVPVPQFYRDEVHIAYQIFPIAYADEDGNGIGDLAGIIGQLDYLKDDLNVDVIWLNPVHPSPSYHKYDVTDYLDIDLSFGTLEDYKTLLDEAHKREIRVLLDFVINHTSSRHPWFLNANSATDSKYRDYYVWNDFSEDEFISKNGWYRGSSSGEYYFASFWSEMPELNFENPAVRQEIKDIAKFWLDLGVDGFRIDAAKHVFDINEYPKGTGVMEMNYNWFKEFNAHIKEVKPDAFLLLETWDSYNSIDDFLVGTDSAFNFDLGESIISAVDGSYRKSLQGKVEKILNTYDKVTEEYVDSVFLANHDQDRVMSQLKGNVDKAKLAVNIEFTLPGISWIYYGDEIGMLGTGAHENIREPFKWTADKEAYPNSQWRTWNYNKDVMALDEQREDPNSLFNTYKAVTSLKANDDVLKFGEYVDYEIPGAFKSFAFYRVYENTTYLVLHNLAEEVLTFESNMALTDIVYQTGSSSMKGLTLTLEPLETIIFKVADTSIELTEIK